MTEDMDQGDESGRRPILLSDDYIHSYAAKTLAYDLKNELERGCLTLHYQVQMSADGGIYGAEALLRWNHPVAGYIAPPLIIQLASESGTASGFGEFYSGKSLYGYTKNEPCVGPESEGFSQHLPEPAGAEGLEQTCAGFLVTL